MGERIVGDGTPNRDFVAKEEVDLGKALSACSKFLWREEYQSYRMLIVATITRILSSHVKIPIDAVETLPADILRVTKIEGEKRDMKGVMICVNCIACLCTYPAMCKHICRKELLSCLTSLASSFSEDNHIMLQIAIVLMYYTKDAEHITPFIESGVLPIVKSSVYSMATEITTEINTRQSIGEVVYPFASIVHHLTFSSEGLDYIRLQRFVASLKELYMQCRGDVAVADECCRVLIRMIARKENCVEMYKEGGIELLMMIAKSCVENEETIRLCIQVIRVITYANDEGIPLLLQNEFFMLLEMLFKTYPLSSCVLIQCFYSILHIQEQKQLFLLSDLLDTRIIKTISIVLEKHREPRLLKISFTILYELISNAKNAEDAIRVRREIDDCDIIPLSVSVIQFISIDSESLISALNFFILFSKEGALFIIVVMGREHSKDVELAMALLSRLLMLPYSQEVVFSKGGIPLILTLLQQHSNEPEMVFCGLSCLGYLLHDNYSACSVLSDLDAIPLIISLCVSYVEKKDKGIVTQVLGIVSNLLVASQKHQRNGDIIIMKLLANDLVQLIDKLLVIFPKDKRIIYQCVTSLAVLSFTAEGMVYLKNSMLLIDHLQATVATLTNLPQTVELATIVLKKLGCVIT
ncbi:hypothetical protein BLSTO_01813 [Blastocystis sp. subtype 1]